MHGEGCSASGHRVSPGPLIVPEHCWGWRCSERESQRVLYGLVLVPSLVCECTKRSHLNFPPLQADLPQNQLAQICQRGKSAPEPSPGSLFPLHPHPPDHESHPNTSLFSSFPALNLLPELPAGLVEVVSKSLI